jgi:L-malate glycosyltransferase
MRVLYVNHTAVVSGGERSLLDLLAALGEQVAPTLAAPAGTLTQLARQNGVPVSEIHGTAGSLRLHPLHTPRAVAEMGLAALQVRRAAARVGAQLLHANSIRAGIVCGLARPRATPIVVHVRDCLPPGAVSSASMRLIAATATTIVANSAYTARSVLAAAPRATVEVVHNGIDLDRFDPRRIDREASRAQHGAPGSLLLGVVAQLSPWKGQDTAIRALALLRDQGIDARLLLIGSARFVDRATRYDNQAYVRELQALASELRVAERISWLGEREDVAELIAGLDMLLLPSREEPFGRAVIEAMALAVPVLATEVGGPAEIFEDGREGFLLTPGDPAEWARAAAVLAADAELRARMGAAGRELVERRFTRSRHVEQILGVYERALARAAAQ